jgi:hypothetical protein
MARNVVAFVGQDENGTIREGCLGLMRDLATFGLAGHVVNVNDPAWTSHFQELAQQGILIGWGVAGIGANLTLNGQNLWETLRVPFVSALADTPSWLPQAHRPPSRSVILGYFFDDWLDVQRRFIRAPNVCARLPTCVAPNPHRDRIPWHLRSHRMVFVKTGDSPAARRAQWANWPSRLRAVLEDAASEACRQGTMNLTDLLLDCVASHQLVFDSRTEYLLALMQELDLFVRAERSTRMVQALSRLPVEIIGRGWDHIDRSKAVAAFRPAVDAAHLHELMADTQFVVNTTPNFGSGMHERVLAAFAARACVVSDHNDYSRNILAGVPSFFGVEWHTDDLADRLADIFAIAEDLGPATDVALQLTETVFAPVNFMQALLELGEIGRLSKNLADSGFV